MIRCVFTNLAQRRSGFFNITQTGNEDESLLYVPVLSETAIFETGV